MIDEGDRFVVAPVGCTQRWVVDKPVDPYGDGYIHTMLVEVSDSQLSASSSATLQGRTPETLPEFLVGLARDWRGWPGVRSWTSIENEMTLDASHDGRAHVWIAVTLRGERAYEVDAWSARIVLPVEAGEELRRLADAAERILQP